VRKFLRSSILAIDHRVEPLADAIRLRALHLRPGVVDVLDREIQLVLMPLRRPAVLGTAIRQHAAQRDAVRLDERDDPFVEEVGRRQRRLRVVQLCERHLAVRVDEGLLVDAAHTPFSVPTENVSCAPQYPGHSLSNSPWARDLPQLGGASELEPTK
jgi:hypothetical protein